MNAIVIVMFVNNIIFNLCEFEEASQFLFIVVLNYIGSPAYMISSLAPYSLSILNLKHSIVCSYFSPTKKNLQQPSLIVTVCMGKSGARYFVQINIYCWKAN